MKRNSTHRPRIDETRYAGQWLALHPQTCEVVAAGDTLQAARSLAMERGVPDPVYHSVPESAGYFIGAASFAR